MGHPGSDNWIATAAPAGSVGSDGLFDARLVAPVGNVTACLQIIVERRADDGRSDSTPGAWATSLPYLSSGGALAPNACARLPEHIWLTTGGRLATVSPPPHQVGTPITISGRLPVFGNTTGLSVRFSIEHGGDLPNDFAGAGVDVLGRKWDANGDFAYTFSPRSNPALSGLCIDVQLLLGPVSGLGHPFALGRFTHP